MRPFYEQQFYNNRPKNKGGEDFLVHFVNDFTSWHDACLCEAATVMPAGDYLTACTALDRREFRRIVRAGIGGYLRKNGEWPDFFRPRSFGAMNILHSILMPLEADRIPADKLKAGSYIPPKYRNRCRTAQVFRQWEPDERISFDGLPAGKYYLKSNHASAQVMKIELPCDAATLEAAQTAADEWLATDYGRHSSQWWYGFIERRAFLEEDLNTGSEEPLTDFRFHIINGRMSVLQMDVGLGTGDRHNPVYDSNLNYMPYDFLRQNLHEEPLPRHTELARDIAVEIGSQFQYCRVDLYLRGDEVFLGELTFLPNAGRRHVRSPELDEMLCADWSPMPRFVRLEEIAARQAA